MVSSRIDHASEEPIHLIASLGFISDENAHPNVGRGSSKGENDAIVFGSKPNTSMLSAPTLPPWLSAVAGPRRGSKLSTTKKGPKDSAHRAGTAGGENATQREQPTVVANEGSTANPPWTVRDFQEVMLRAVVERGAEDGDGDGDVGLHLGSSPLFRWLVISSRLLSGVQTSPPRPFCPHLWRLVLPLLHNHPHSPFPHFIPSSNPLSLSSPHPLLQTFLHSSIPPLAHKCR